MASTSQVNTEEHISEMIPVYCLRCKTMHLFPEGAPKRCHKCKFMFFYYEEVAAPAPREVAAPAPREVVTPVPSVAGN